jgi:hypothetical protein
MLVVIASAYDKVAANVVEAWKPLRAKLCTPADLSVAGWRHRVGWPGDARAVVSGRVTHVAEITGVWTRLLRVESSELIHISPADRPYVAAEMTAFLTAFLAALRCPVLNRPSAVSLSGPGWRPERWTRVANAAGIPVQPLRRSTHLHSGCNPPVDEAIKFTIIGERVFGTADAVLAGWAKALAMAAGVGILEVHFARVGEGYALASVNPWPAIDFPGGSDAIRDELLRSPNSAALQ